MRTALILCGLIALAAPDLDAQTIEPGTTSPKLEAESCFTDRAFLRHGMCRPVRPPGEQR
jgi:hypothetical protein